MAKLFFKETYSPLSSDEIVAKEKANMDNKRFKHCVRVSETSRKLAKLNDYDEDKAALAGFVHDYAKQVPKEEYRKVIKTQGFDQDLLNWNRSIWHGIVGTYFIKRDLKITDKEILTAVDRHTTRLDRRLYYWRPLPSIGYLWLALGCCPIGCSTNCRYRSKCIECHYLFNNGRTRCRCFSSCH